jgi:hypothetical protein
MVLPQRTNRSRERPTLERASLAGKAMLPTDWELMVSPHGMARFASLHFAPVLLQDRKDLRTALHCQAETRCHNPAH